MALSGALGPISTTESLLGSPAVHGNSTALEGTAPLFPSTADDCCKLPAGTGEGVLEEHTGSTLCGGPSFLQCDSYSLASQLHPPLLLEGDNNPPSHQVLASPYQV